MIFKFKFTNLIKAVLTAIILLTAISLIATFYVIFSYTKLPFNKKIFYISTTVICLLFFILSLLLAFIKRYKIVKDKIVLRLGIFKWTFYINKITELSLYQNKLILFTENATYSRIVIDETEYDLFIKTVRDINPKIIYSKNK